MDKERQQRKKKLWLEKKGEGKPGRENGLRKKDMKKKLGE